MSVSSEYSSSTIDDMDYTAEQKAIYGFTDDDLAPYTVAGLRKDAKKKGLSNDEIKKVIKQRRRVKVRKYSKNFRAREQQQMADMEVEIRVLHLRKQKLIDEKTKLITESAKFKKMVQSQPIVAYPQLQHTFLPISNFLTPKTEPIDPSEIKRNISSPSYTFFPSQTDNFTL
ncbi:hypothetical protein LOD99_12960 [Oopsacas minuta]|uniref:Basic leucine zipper domain-containing protein n=1 Tax=Oopsacas minuta TaxID=111878 RepID=A0AAV7J7Y8_9METZ|nr:hypothetical protein LOD99_12960 [Oopsacas minuta]